MKKMDTEAAKKILKAFGKKNLPLGMDDTYHGDYEALARNVIARERLIWAMNEKLSLSCKCTPSKYTGRNLALSEEDAMCFCDAIYENYVWGEDCIFSDTLFGAFTPLGDVTQDCVCLQALLDPMGSVREGYDTVLDQISPETLMNVLLDEPGAAKAIPLFETMLRESLSFDPGREYSDPVALLLKSERIGRYLSSGKKDAEITRLLKIVSEPIVSNFFCYAGEAEGVWYCGTIMAAIDEYSMVTFDALNPRFAAACVLLDDKLKQYEEKGEQGKTNGACECAPRSFQFLEFDDFRFLGKGTEGGCRVFEIEHLRVAVIRIIHRLQAGICIQHGFSRLPAVILDQCGRQPQPFAV